jgi:manganese transport protein
LSPPDTTKALVISQVILSFVLPVPPITLLLYTGSRSVMGISAKLLAISALAIGGTAIVLSPNVVFLVRLALPR